MDNSNIKVYLAVSGALIVLLILIIVIPFSSKKTTDNKLPSTNSLPLPTTVQTGSQTTNPRNQVSITIPADFTGAIDEPIPQNIIDISNQKKDLQSKAPLSLSTFTIDFDYGEDEFVVTLKDPKDQSQKEFESWRTANYPGLSTEQFSLK